MTKRNQSEQYEKLVSGSNTYWALRWHVQHICPHEPVLNLSVSLPQTDLDDVNITTVGAALT